jgi:CRISPR-associated protein, Cas1 family
MQKDGRVVFLTENETEKQYWNIPIANTTVILLGSGTSITQAAVRMLASAGVMIGFSGTGGTPLISATEVEWLSPQSEYRPTEYMQGWMQFWFDDVKRLEVAKQFQAKRIQYLQQVWQKDADIQAQGFYCDDRLVEKEIDTFEGRIASAMNVTDLLTAEGLFTKQLYAYAAQKTQQKNFKRDFDNEDLANAFLNHGNYLAYGLAATTLWVMGIPHGFAVMHGKTRRGALVFDVADLIKDTLILPWAFIGAKEQMTEQEFRQQCLQSFAKHKTLDFMFEAVKQLSLEGPNL